MKVIVCPGYSTRNTQLIADAKENYDEVIAITWSHWSGEEDFEEDYTSVVHALQSHPRAVVIAKSYGAVLVMKTLSEYLVANKEIILMGVPRKALDTHDFDMDTITNRVRVIQNEFDPHGSYEEISKHFESVSCIQKNDTHTYNLPDLNT